MKKKLLIIFIIILSLAIFLYLKSSFFWGVTIQVKNVTQKQIITIVEKNRPRHVYRSRILITGYIDGTATIQRSYEDKKMYEPSTISGKVHLRFGGDWYGDKCLLIYEPSNVKSGKLQIRYDFGTL